MGTFYPMIATEARVVVNIRTGLVTKVEDFGSPYAFVYGQDSSWFCGVFNINKVSDTSARISTTGQFFVNNESLTTGGDIISVAINF